MIILDHLGRFLKGLTCHRPPGSIIELLEQSQFTFVPTGSRRFGTANWNSDHDFFYFGEHPDAAKLWLGQQGFKPASEAPWYRDIAHATVYRRDKVDVQIRDNCVLFAQINEWFDRTSGAYAALQRLNQQERNGVWKFLHEHPSLTARSKQPTTAG